MDMRPSRQDLNRAYYLSTRRSTVELEHYLGRFYAHRALGFSSEKLRRYLSVLEMDDKVLQKILLEDESLPQGSDTEMLTELRNFHPHAGERE
jgi:succinate dehydrogenase flavin-adding protein (antitoxin of CptAB toxin-antitoxin module)